MKVHYWDENLPLDQNHWCDESLSMWLELINTMKILYRDEILSIWWFLYMWWKIITVMKIHHSDRNLSLWWKLTNVMRTYWCDESAQVE